VALERYLQIQKDRWLKQNQSLRLGDIVSQDLGIQASELNQVSADQLLVSFIQSLSWTDGEYEWAQLDLDYRGSFLFRAEDLVNSLESLVSVEADAAPTPSLFSEWVPQGVVTDLSQLPLWRVLAGCRLHHSHGIIHIRKQTKLYEIVVKNGVPLLLYEGTFGQPRQTLIARTISGQHESFFVDELFRLFSFLSGHLSFRILRSREDERESYLQLIEEASTPAGTQVTQSFRAETIFEKLKLPQRSLWQRLVNRLRFQIDNVLGNLRARFQKVFKFL
jgi:hypothetical protein